MGFWETLKSFLTDNKGDNGSSNIELPLATAVLLMEIARSDIDVAESELKIIKSVLQSYFTISHEEIEQTLQMAQQHVEALVCLHDFTRVINKAYTEQQKEHLIKAFWDVAYADGVLDGHEEHWIGRLSSLLHVPRTMVMKHRHFSKPKKQK